MRPPELELLRAVLTQRNPSLLPLLEQLDYTPLTAVQREALRSAIADEQGERGIGDDGALNAKGVLLDDLIDRLGHV